MSGYNSNANAQTLAEVLQHAPEAKGRFWSRKLELGARNYDDFAMFEGGEGSKNAFWVKRDLKKNGGDKVTFTVMSDVAGPGVRGEQELTGNTSKPRFHTYDCIVDYFRDAFELTKKEEKFLAAGGSVEAAANSALEKKLGRQKQNDMMMSLILRATGNIYRPGGATSRDTITHNDVLSLNDAVIAKNHAQRLGARQMDITKNKHGSPVHGYLCFASDIGMLDITQSTPWQNAVHNAGTRGDMNPQFTGRLVDWHGIGFFEHLTVDPDWDDVISDPLCPKLLLGQACNVTTPELVANPDNLRHLYTQWMGGYDYMWYEGQAPNPDSGRYYGYVINPNGDLGFCSWVGTANNGNRITVDEIMTSGTESGIAKHQVGNLDKDYLASAGVTVADSYSVDAWVIPANANGVPIGHSFLFGAGAAVRAYGSTVINPIQQKRDYDFVKGFGYESIFGQAPCRRTDNKTHNYVLIEHAIEHPGLPVISVGEYTP